MTLKNLQEEVDKWAQQFKKPYWRPLSMLARLTEETGEVAKEINDLYGDKKKRIKTEKGLGDELADVIFTVVCIANRDKISLQNYWDKMMKEKHYGRDNNRYKRK
jgi:NTP pyrophosphatase (non-canonical NTP hydrolase)